MTTRDNYLSVAIHDLQQAAGRMIQKDTTEFHLVYGLLRIAQGLQQESSMMEARLIAIEVQLSRFQ